MNKFFMGVSLGMLTVVALQKGKKQRSGKEMIKDKIISALEA